MQNEADDSLADAFEKAHEIDAVEELSEGIYVLRTAKRLDIGRATSTN